MRLLYI